MSHLKTKRLHISPLDSPLLNAILHPSTRDLVTDISLHTIQTFPENNYGFITLPAAEADKLMKKLNGSILKGRKLQIQEAKPKTKRELEENVASDVPSLHNQTMATKRKAGNDSIEGYALSSKRRVMRGWTDASEKEKRSRKADATDEKRKKNKSSKYTNKPECLFRTALPSNKASLAKPNKQPKKGSPGRISALVHEFEKSTAYPTFLRVDQGVSATHLTSEYVEGKGWVDRNGNLRESLPMNTTITNHRPVALHEEGITESMKGADRKQRMTAKDMEAPSSLRILNEEGLLDATQSSVSGKGENLPRDTFTESDSDSCISDTSNGTSTSQRLNAGTNANPPTDEESTEDTSSEGGSTSDDSGSGKSSSESEAKQNSTDEASPNKSLITRDTPEPTPIKEVHPLEALFKKSASETTDMAKRPHLEVKTAFTFFGNAEADSDVDVGDENGIFQAINRNTGAEPQTPFTKRDLQFRGLRSGAPTPDTAAVSKIKFWDEDEEEEKDDSDENDVSSLEATSMEEADDGKNQRVSTTKVSKEKETSAAEESEFAKWFWENRGDNNRAWKRRRREAAKEKRQRENRQRGRR
ncbi:hypothetical protein LOZ57_001328 [Ophidiomyces ophidiicola]|uniref:uncharacterized protein n=1 Tax=Ophidiomyces ophidiicola TaxID=1387563 RepID=UPI0020C5AFF6|nr:uncharacterized protein LOZ57_001328 [Ophidiomyces ophidiicola]KAI1951915.1 hypothetical protein LOZ57_001328 [Ophidiomyces ophidiicola]KAI2045330.1 hypothetical protein LOZ43_006109 [Ophidiomyces ophidiicola]KAI2086562.1 hypothetical protein LOZ36_003272 [Ophidiomyces ophidiicola]